MDNTKSDDPQLPSYIDKARELFVREPTNPILTAADMPIPCKAVCNPAACLVNDEVLLLLRVIDPADKSHLFVARSADGVGNWRVEPTPLLSPADAEAGWYDDWGCEDPRITYVEEIGQYVITYVGYSRYGAGVCQALTQDFVTAKRLGMAVHPYNKDAVLFPRKIGGRYLMLHRPTSPGRWKTSGFPKATTSCTGATRAAFWKKPSSRAGTAAKSGPGRRRWKPSMAGF